MGAAAISCPVGLRGCNVPSGWTARESPLRIAWWATASPCLYAAQRFSIVCARVWVKPVFCQQMNFVHRFLPRRVPKITIHLQVRGMARDTIVANSGEARMTDKANRTVTRRRVIAGTAMALGGLALSGGQGAAQEKSAKAGRHYCNEGHPSGRRLQCQRATHLRNTVGQQALHGFFWRSRGRDSQRGWRHVLPFRWPHCRTEP